jgi:E3 ubiquitin-protein ligase SHPRH
MNNAPTLKVLIYDGWTKVAVPIVKDDRELQLGSLRLDDDNLQKKKNGAKGKKRASDDSDYTDSTVAEESTPRRSKRRRNNQLDWCNHVHQFDVVITTYSVLRSEIWVARPPPDRPKREDAMYTTTARARSPLVMVKWQRVVMDEVQMVGGGQAA